MRVKELCVTMLCVCVKELCVCDRAACDGPCHQAPRPPHKVKVDVPQCHACHTKWSHVTASPGTKRATSSPVTQVLRLPHRMKVVVTKCRPRPATQSASATCATPATQKCRSGSPSATPATQPSATIATQNGTASPGTKRATRASPVPQVPRLPHRMEVGVTKPHACHTKWRSMSPSAAPATPATHRSAGRCRQVVPSATPAAHNEGRCPKRHACHTKWSGVTGNQAPPVFTPATQREGRCHQVPWGPPHKMDRCHREAS